MEELLKYFPELTYEQKKQFELLGSLYREWNEKINVISRQDINNLYEHHILHSMSIAKVITFTNGTNILDFGTGGGFPGIPLAILFPLCHFKLIDGTSKKIKVVREISQAIGLNNVTAEHIRGEEEKEKFDFIISRAVMPFSDLVKIIKKNIRKEQHNAFSNGVFALKGGDLKKELEPFMNFVSVTPIQHFYEETWFSEKNIIYLPL